MVAGGLEDSSNMSVLSTGDLASVVPPAKVKLAL